MQILPLFKKHTVLHFNKTDARLANNGIPVYLQKLRCRVNFQALKFSPQIETLGYKLIRLLQEKGPIVVLHLRYEMDMLAFSGCTHGCTTKEADELKQMRFVNVKIKLLRIQSLKSFPYYCSQSVYNNPLQISGVYFYEIWIPCWWFQLQEQIF